jgi:DNA replication factor GINS
LQSQLNQKEREVATRLLQELRETRIRKIICAARDGNELNDADLTDDEKKVVKGLGETLAESHPNETSKVNAAVVEPERTIMSVVRFLQDIPEIVGTDLRLYGPYRKEDVGSLPSQNAEALMKQGAAKMIEVRNMLREPT